MGRKRKREVVEEEEVDEEENTSVKKKSKKVKRKKRHSKDDEDTPTIVVQDVDVPPPIHRPLTLKIKLGSSEVLTTDSKSNDQLSIGDTSSLKSSHFGLPEEEWMPGSDDVSLGGESYQQSGQEEDHDEEAWLNALEAGTVNERGYLPQKRDPTNMTARQRAMLGSKEEELLELPLMKKHDEVESEEMLLKKTERNKKRRLQAIKRREKHKAETVQKLLQKQSTKKKEDDKKATPQVTGPHLCYISSLNNGISLSLTPGLEYPLKEQSGPLKLPDIVKCTICPNIKKYSHSKTGLPLCSLECYKKLNQLSANTSAGIIIYILEEMVL